MHELIALGVEFDREATGSLALAREGGHSRPGSSTPGARPPAPRWSAPSSTPPTARPARCSRGGSPSTSWSRAADASGCTALPPEGPATARWRCAPTTSCWPPAAPASSSRSRPTRPSRPVTAWPWRCGPACPTADVEFVQFHPTALHHPAMPRPLLSEALRGHGALLRDRDGERFVDELAPRDVVSRAMAARMADAGRRPPLARRHRARALLAAVPDHRRLAGVHRARPAARLAAHRPGRPPPLGRRGDRPVGRHGAAGPVGGGRGGLHRRARRQPAGLELAARGHGLRGPPGRAHRVGARAAPSRAARCGPSSAPRRSTGIGCTVRGASRPSPGRAAADRLPGLDVTKLRDTLQRAMTPAPGWCAARESLGAARAVVDDIGGRARRAAPPRSPPASWPTCCRWPTRCWPRRWPAPRAGAPTPAASTPSVDPAWRRRLVHGRVPRRSAP